MEVKSERKEQLNLFARTSNHIPDILPVPRGLREHAAFEKNIFYNIFIPFIIPFEKIFDLNLTCPPVKL